MKKVVFGISGILLVAILAGTGWYFSQRKTTCKEKCNVLLISIDSLRADHMGVYGYSRDTTPNIDKLAQKGTVFENYIASSYLTPTSEMSVQTGLYPTSNGITNFDSKLAQNVTTLAERMQRIGYVTSAILTSPEFSSTPAIHESFARGYDSYPKLTNVSANDPEMGRALPDIEKVTTAASDNGKPKFTWLAIGKLHWPFGVNVDSIFTDPAYNGQLAKVKLDTPYFLFLFDGVQYGMKQELSESDKKYIADQYDNGIHTVDAYIGKLMNRLKEENVLRNTIVIIQAEHGEALGEHGYYAHYDIHDSQTRTPLIVIDPRHSGGQRFTLPVGSTDVTPTILGLVGEPIPPGLQGLSLSELIRRGQQSINRDAVYTQRVPLWEETALQPMRSVLNSSGRQASNPQLLDIAIRTNDWKYIRRLSSPLLNQFSWWGFVSGKKVTVGSEELYDLKSDPDELTNVATKYPNITQELGQRLDEWYLKVQNKEQSSPGSQELIQPYQ